MGIVVGPVLSRVGGYRFDTWIASHGMTPGYSYRRIEDAYYARKAAIKSFAQSGASSAMVCNTLDEFVAQTTAYEMLATA